MLYDLRWCKKIRWCTISCPVGYLFAVAPLSAPEACYVVIIYGLMKEDPSDCELESFNSVPLLSSRSRYVAESEAMEMILFCGNM